MNKLLIVLTTAIGMLLPIQSAASAFLGHSSNKSGYTYYGGHGSSYQKRSGYTYQRTYRRAYRKHRRPSRPRYRYTRHYGAKLCKDPLYKCRYARRGDTWHRLFPDASERDIVKRVNRMNTRVRYGMPVAIPKNLKELEANDISPFAAEIEPPENKVIIMDHSKHAYAAYNTEGKLVKWGPASGGRAWCSDVQEKCQTTRGKFHIYYKRGANCESTIFPLPNV